MMERSLEFTNFSYKRQSNEHDNSQETSSSSNHKVSHASPNNSDTEDTSHENEISRDIGYAPFNEERDAWGS